MKRERKTKELMERFNNTIKELRKKAGMSKKDFSKEIKISPSTLRRWELLKSCPKLTHFYILHEKFGITTKDIFGQPSPEIIENTKRLAKRIKELKNKKP